MGLTDLAILFLVLGTAPFYGLPVPTLGALTRSRAAHGLLYLTKNGMLAPNSRTGSSPPSSCSDKCPHTLRRPPPTRRAGSDARICARRNPHRQAVRSQQSSEAIVGISRKHFRKSGNLLNAGEGSHPRGSRTVEGPLLVPQRHHRIDLRRPTRRDVSGCRGDGQ